MNAQSVHASQEDLHAVAIGALRVLLCEQSGEWFAQGIEIDYAATGATQEQVKQRFENGLAATIHLHLQRFGSVERLLRFAPESVWKRLTARHAYALSMVTMHELSAHLGEDAENLPFERLVYLSESGARRAA